MNDALGYGDDSFWKGLACPPLEEFAFNFDDTCYKLDCILDDPLLEDEIEEEYSITTNGNGKELNLVEQVFKIENPRITSIDCQRMNQVKGRTGLDCTNEVDGNNKRINKVVVTKSKSNHCYGNFGKGKELKLNLNLAEIEAFLEEEIEEVIEKKDKKRKIMHDDNCQPVQRKDRTRLNPTNRFIVVDNKRKDDFDLDESTGQAMQRKDVKGLDHKNPFCAVDNKRKAVSDVRLEVLRHKNELVVAEKMRQVDYDLKFEVTTHKLHEPHESTGQPMQRKDVKRLDHMNRLGVVDNKRRAGSDLRSEASRHMHQLAEVEKKKQADYDLKFEATTHKLHELYERLNEAKQQKKIQVIEFRKSVMKQPRCTTKLKGKSRLMATGTRKSNKKFHPFVY